MSEVQNKTEVQTLIDYFDKLIGTFRTLLIVATTIIGLVAGLFAVLLFKNKEDADNQVTAAQENAVAAIKDIRSLTEKTIGDTRSNSEKQIQDFVSKSENDIEAAESKARVSIEDVSSSAQKEINNIKFAAKQKVSEEVDKFIKSPEIQDEISRKVKKEIEEKYSEHTIAIGRIEAAAARMGTFKGMVELIKFSKEGETDILRKYATDRLNSLCYEVMKWDGAIFPIPNSTPVPDEIKKEEGPKLLGRMEIYLQNVQHNDNADVEPLRSVIRRVNQIFGKSYTVCEYEEVIKFLRNYKG